MFMRYSQSLAGETISVSVRAERSGEMILHSIRPQLSITASGIIIELHAAFRYKAWFFFGRVARIDESPKPHIRSSRVVSPPRMLWFPAFSLFSSTSFI
jgi:hypothetical protein